MKTVRHDVKTHLDEGTHSVPEQEHLHMRGHQVHLDISEHTDPNVIVRYDSEVSIDGGKTWTYGGGFTRAGGPSIDTQGRPLRYATVVFGHEPHPSRPPAARRLVRATLSVSGGVVHTKCHTCGVKQADMDLGQIPTD